MPAGAAALLAGAMLIHQLWWTGPVVWHPHSAIVLAALWVLGRPSSERRFLVLAATTTVVLVPDLLRVSDHRLLVLAVCVSALVLAATRRPLAGLAPSMRAEAVLLYAAAALAKLNGDFLDPATSDAASMVLRLPLAAEWTVQPAIVATVAVEAALAVLLAVPRTRRWGVVLGLGFHAVLALAGNVPFAAVMAALYVAFVPGPRVADRAWLFPVLAAVWLLLAAVGLEPGVRGGWSGDVLRWSIAAALLIAATRVAPPLPSARLPRVLVPLLALLVLNAAGPYLGFKRDYVFAPFSDLRTEPGRWNHLVVPEGVRIFD